jgi:hypothetical protein
MAKFINVQRTEIHTVEINIDKIQYIAGRGDEDHANIFLDALISPIMTCTPVKEVLRAIHFAQLDQVS